MITVRCPAKLNLCFDILGSRADGYHEVETIMQSVDLEDELKVKFEKSAQNEFLLSCPDPYLRRLVPLDEKNLIIKAGKAYLEKLRPSSAFRIEIELEKKIPVGAGLAGGSADAAAMLVAMNHFFKKSLESSELHELAAQIGSDVPFCLEGGSKFASGRGEILQELDSKLSFHCCIVKPRKLSVSTPWAFNAYDGYTGSVKKPDTLKAKLSIETGDLEQLMNSMSNVFEPVIFESHKELQELKTELLKSGAWHCQMTGSGPTLFAVVASREMGQHLRRQMLHDDELGFSYGTEEMLMEALPPVDFRLAETCDYGARIICSED